MLCTYPLTCDVTCLSCSEVRPPPLPPLVAAKQVPAILLNPQCSESAGKGSRCAQTKTSPNLKESTDHRIPPAMPSSSRSQPRPPHIMRCPIACAVETPLREQERPVLWHLGLRQLEAYRQPLLLQHVGLLRDEDRKFSDTFACSSRLGLVHYPDQLAIVEPQLRGLLNVLHHQTSSNPIA